MTQNCYVVEVEGVDGKKRKVVTQSKCKELVNIEVEQNVTMDCVEGKKTKKVPADKWTGECTHKHKSSVALHIRSATAGDLREPLQPFLNSIDAEIQHGRHRAE